ncbi:Outer membrane protein beta-barrel domain-containing protein [Chishuiella changwenlii]|jgi:hypothetical protein|uniref:Outer membrane protein beta-barrel domain-containing protein n=1 Tax=Chishuiella changwenlii TaxID=1434701 RepID=A0A1M6Y3H8_9FLAO|nr:porin family protein [Chishuiella changwenlii]GGE93657.1 hypothetical protein GCM10010984_09120 [Chishuiella changwenlii]SHL12752.1 Outer membrane protein beta-barrel domain-containing protein [Chishuiella changwenlii]
MKRILTVVVLIAGLAGAHAQDVKNEKNESSLEVIVKGGINISNQAITNVNGEKSKVGFQGGVGVNINTGLGNFSVQPEVNFISKGTKLNTPIGKREFNLNYLEVPVLAKYSFGPVYVNAGPSIGFQMGKNDNVKAAYGKTKTIDFGLQMGAGVALPVGPGKIILDGRYNLGLSDIADTNIAKIKNRGVAISLGYAYSL